MARASRKPETEKETAPVEKPVAVEPKTESVKTETQKAEHTGMSGHNKFSKFKK